MSRAVYEVPLCTGRHPARRRGQLALRGTHTRNRHPRGWKMSGVMRKPAFCICENMRRSASCGTTAQLISAFVFATLIVHSLYFLNPKVQASSHRLWLYSLVCVEPGRKPRRQVFSLRGSNVNDVIDSEY